MSPKNAIKIINIQKSYLVHIGSIWSIMSTTVHKAITSPFDPIQSILSTKVLFGLFGLLQSTSVLLGPFSPHWSYFVHFSSIQSKLVLFSSFCPLLSYSVHFVHFGLIRFILSTLILFHSIWSILSTLVHFSPIRAIRYTLVLFGLFCPLCSTRSTLVLFSPFFPLQSYSIHIGPIWSTSV